MASLLVCSTPVHGHVTPLLAVARFLIERGHRVRFLTGERYRNAVAATGATYLPLPAEADYDDSDMDAAFPGRVGLKGPAGIRYDVATIFLGPAPAQLRAIDAALEAEPADAILAEGLFIGVTFLLSRPRAARPAVVSLGVLPLGLTSVDTAPFGLGIPPLRGPIGRLRNALLRLVAEKIVFGSLQAQFERMVRETTGNTITNFFMNSAALADAVVQFTVSGFEYPRRDLPPSVHFVGPVSRAIASATPLPAWWNELDGSRPVVHVTQGTVANKEWGELIAPTIAGLADEKVLVVVSTGGRDVASLPHPLPANVRVSAYLPYDRLLPLTDVYVSNGGYGGVHYAMEHGVPIVVAGETEDKTEVSARIGWSGVGVNLKTNRPSPDQVRTAVLTVLGSAEYRHASAGIGAQIAASPGLDGLESVIVGLADANRTSHL
ncbi:glycosyltransferase [Parafrigoribacterium mesophilum]|uniref:glycosyltransferase n=1 Tax=Parafrigoribacterium mesophilum TaxID=433646 RepID=UPI0031FE2464